MSQTRNSIARFLFAAVSLAVLGVYGYFYGLEQMAKWAFAHQTYFAADELILISVPQATLTPETAQLLQQGEFEWEGDMVDVLHREVRSDTLFVYGFRDKAEKDLKKKAAWLYQDSTHPSQRTDTRTKRMKWVSWIEPALQIVFDARWSFRTISARSFFSHTSPRRTGPLLEVPYPPPIA